MTTPTRKPYLTDLTDDQWNIMQPLIPPAKPWWATASGGHARNHQHYLVPQPHRVPMGHAATRIVCPRAPSMNTLRNGETMARGSI